MTDNDFEFMAQDGQDTYRTEVNVIPNGNATVVAIIQHDPDEHNTDVVCMSLTDFRDLAKRLGAQ